jgi:glutaredoxin
MHETGHRTVPMIFLGDNFIGGCDDLRRHVRQGTLLNQPRSTKD